MGTYTANKGIIIIFNKDKISIKNFEIIVEGQMVKFQSKHNSNLMNFVAIYAPPECDDPNFLLTAKSALDSMPGDNGVIIGDFNSTKDPEKDRVGYQTDNHKKCRVILNSWEDTEELIDTFRHIHPESKSFTFRTKGLNKKSRLDYAFATPSLLLVSITSLIPSILSISLTMQLL